jgi:hypothetical protein
MFWFWRKNKWMLIPQYTERNLPPEDHQSHFLKLQNILVYLDEKTFSACGKRTW